MSKVTTLNPAADEPTDYKAAVIECIGKIDLLMKQMAEDQKVIDHLKAETKEILERFKGSLRSYGSKSSIWRSGSCYWQSIRIVTVTKSKNYKSKLGI